MNTQVDIRSDDYWFKVVDFLQQNWALVEQRAEHARVWFLDDLGGVFDQIDFQSGEAATEALVRNGFERLRLTRGWAPKPPAGPFTTAEHSNGKIYSSGRYWR